MAEQKVKYYVIVPCELGKDGKIVDSSTAMPSYGYHHIRKVYEDDTSWLSATVDVHVEFRKVLDIARIIAGDLPVRIDAEFLP